MGYDASDNLIYGIYIDLDELDHELPWEEQNIEIEVWGNGHSSTCTNLTNAKLYVYVNHIHHSSDVTYMSGFREPLHSGRNVMRTEQYANNQLQDDIHTYVLILNHVWKERDPNQVDEELLDQTK